MRVREPRLLRAWSTAFVCVCAVSVSLAAQTASPTEPEVYPAEPGINRKDKDLRRFLETHPRWFRTDVAAWFVDAEANMFGIVSAEENAIAVASPIGQIRIPISSLRHAEELDLWRGIQEVRAAGVEPVDPGRPPKYGLRFIPVLGNTLRAGECLWAFEEASLWRVEKRGSELRKNERNSLRYAAKAVVTSLSEDPELASVVTPLMAELVPDDSLPALVRSFGHIQTTDSTRVSAESLRRILRAGWIRQVLPGSSQVETLAQRLEKATTPSLGTTWESEGRALHLVEDAFKVLGYVLEEVDHTVLQLWFPDPRSIYAPDASFNEITVEMRLPPNVDALDPAVIKLCEEAVVYSGLTELAVWKDGRVRATEHWDRLMRPGKSEEYPDMIDGLPPPHVPLCNVQGDLITLCIGEHRVDFDTASVDPERFLDQAAEALRTPQQIDLLLQHGWIYCHDSPYGSKPDWIGTRDHKGDRWFSAIESLRRSSFGQMRGDCEDYSELVREILLRQGRYPVRIGTTAHASVLWVTEHAGGYRAVIAQTGPTVAFDGPTREGVILDAYRSLDPLRALHEELLSIIVPLGPLRNPTQVRVPLAHIEGRTQRDREALDAFLEHYDANRAGRIRRDVEIVERELLRPGPKAAALENLVRLYAYIEDLDLAKDRLQQLLEIDLSPVGRMRAQGLAAVIARRAGDTAESERALSRMLDVELPSVAAEYGEFSARFTLYSTWHQIAGEADYELAFRVIDSTIDAFLEAGVHRIETLEKEGKEGWFDHEMTRWMTWNGLRGLAWSGLCWGGATSEQWQEVDRRMGELLLEIGPPDAFGLADLVGEVSTLGAYPDLFSEGVLAQELSDVSAEVSVDWRNPPEVDATQLADGSWREVWRPWIEASPEYWSMRLENELERGEGDAGLVTAYSALSASTSARVQRLLGTDPRSENRVLSDRFAARLLRGDQEGAAVTFGQLQELSRNAAMMPPLMILVRAGKHRPAAEVEGLVRAFLQQDPEWLLTPAWMFFASGHPEHARTCARTAAEMFPEQTAGELEILEAAIERVAERER